METDELKYRGSKVPSVIRWAWLLFVIFMVVYLARYAWPDLRDWMRS